MLEDYPKEPFWKNIRIDHCVWWEKVDACSKTIYLWDQRLKDVIISSLNSSCLTQLMVRCCIFWLAFGCCALQTLVVICSFSRFLLVFVENGEFHSSKSLKSSSHFLSHQMSNHLCTFIKPLNYMCYSSKHSIILGRLLRILCKNMKKADFNQCLECTAPKCLLKYTTVKGLAYG